MQLATMRRLATACVLPVAAFAALAAPGAASAFTPEPPTHCNGEEIKGQGSSLQEDAQKNVWDPEFSLVAQPVGCAGGTSSVGAYNPSGSGAGLRSFGAEPKVPAEVSFAPTNAYAGTDNAPNAKQKGEIEAAGGSPVQTIPVLQAAVAFIVHLPADCTASSGKGKAKMTRLVVSNAKLEKIFEGTAHWDEFSEGKDKLKCKGKEGKAAKTSLIKRVVREDGSGTTAITMKYFENISKGAAVIGEPPTKTWDEEAQLSSNTTWPNETANPLIRGKGSSKIPVRVTENPGSIGYVNLANAREGGYGNASGQEFWVEVEHGPGTYADPSTNGPSVTKAASNCEETNYTNGSKHFPPTSTEEAWNEVTTSTTELNYPVCGLTYVLAMTKYEKASGLGATKDEARAVNDFMSFVLSEAPTGGGTKIGENHDYLGLTPLLDGIATAGANKISWE